MADELAVLVARMRFGERDPATNSKRAAAYLDLPGVRAQRLQEPDLDLDRAEASSGWSSVCTAHPAAESRSVHISPPWMIPIGL